MLGGNTHTTPLYTLYMSVFKKLIEKGIENKSILWQKLKVMNLVGILNIFGEM